MSVRYITKSWNLKRFHKIEIEDSRCGLVAATREYINKAFLQTTRMRVAGPESVDELSFLSHSASGAFDV